MAGARFCFARTGGHFTAAGFGLAAAGFFGDRVELVAQDLDHLFGIALTEVAVLLRGKVHVLAIAQSLVEPFGRHHVEVLGLLRELCDVVVRTFAYAAAQHFARKERNVVFEA